MQVSDLGSPSLDRSTRSFGFMDGNGVTVGEGSTYRPGKMFSHTDDANVAYFGRWKRTRGTKGTWFGMTTTCPDGVDAAEVLEPWYGASLVSGT